MQHEFQNELYQWIADSIAFYLVLAVLVRTVFEALQQVTPTVSGVLLNLFVVILVMFFILHPPPVVIKMVAIVFVPTVGIALNDAMANVWARRSSSQDNVKRGP